MTIQELLQTGKLILQNAGISDAVFDARYLLEWVLNESHAYLLLHGTDEVKDSLKDRYMEALRKREQHVPLQYITNEQEFMGYSFYVDERVLIPRQDTEVLVEAVLQHIKQYQGQCEDILDMCCGSGCIGLSIAKYLADHGMSSIVALSDLSEGALEVTRKNAERLDLQVAIVQGDLFQNVKGRYDILVSNPPYIPSKVVDELMPEVREHEPRMALDGEADGLSFYRRIIREAVNYIKEDGYVFFEIGFDQAEDLREIFVEHGFQNMKVQKDLTGHDRVVYTGMPARKD